jgi:hypothetical protein
MARHFICLLVVLFQFILGSAHAQEVDPTNAEVNLTFAEPRIDTNKETYQASQHLIAVYSNPNTDTCPSMPEAIMVNGSPVYPIKLGFLDPGYREGLVLQPSSSYLVATYHRVNRETWQYTSGSCRRIETVVAHQADVRYQPLVTWNPPQSNLFYDLSISVPSLPGYVLLVQALNGSHDCEKETTEGTPLELETPPLTMVLQGGAWAIGIYHRQVEMKKDSSQPGLTTQVTSYKLVSGTCQTYVVSDMGVQTSYVPALPKAMLKSLAKSPEPTARVGNSHRQYQLGLDFPLQISERVSAGIAGVHGGVSWEYKGLRLGIVGQADWLYDRGLDSSFPGVAIGGSLSKNWWRAPTGIGPNEFGLQGNLAAGFGGLAMTCSFNEQASTVEDLQVLCWPGEEGFTNLQYAPWVGVSPRASLGWGELPLGVRVVLGVDLQLYSFGEGLEMDITQGERRIEDVPFNAPLWWVQAVPHAGVEFHWK